MGRKSCISRNCFSSRRWYLTLSHSFNFGLFIPDFWINNSIYFHPLSVFVDDVFLIKTTSGFNLSRSSIFDYLPSSIFIVSINFSSNCCSVSFSAFDLFLCILHIVYPIINRSL